MMFCSRRRIVKDVRLLINHLNRIFATVASRLDVGLTTAEVDALVASEMGTAGVDSTFRQLDFPAHCSTSVNNEVINTIPSTRRLREGDLLKLQLGVHGHGVYATQGWTFPIGAISTADQTLLRTAREALDVAVTQALAGKRVGDISAAIQTRVESAGYSINRKMVGNAIGRVPHQEPSIPGYGSAGQGRKLKKGMILSINVIAHAGNYQARILDDDWNMITTDGKRAALFSHMVVVRKNSPEILTASTFDCP